MLKEHDFWCASLLRTHTLLPDGGLMDGERRLRSGLCLARRPPCPGPSPTSGPRFCAGERDAPRPCGGESPTRLVRCPATCARAPRALGLGATSDALPQ